MYKIFHKSLFFWCHRLPPFLAILFKTFQVPIILLFISLGYLDVKWFFFNYLQHKKFLKVKVLLISNFPAAPPYVSADNSGPGPAVVSWPQSNFFPENEYPKRSSFPYHGINVHNTEKMSGFIMQCRKLNSSYYSWVGFPS